MALTAQQKKVLQTILKVAKQKNASPKEIKAAVETGLVESNLTNPTGGDADSAGWRQERASLYPNPTNVAAAASRFFDEARKANQSGQYGSAGSLAAAVQRPAAQYRERYQADSGQAQQILGAYGAAPAVAAAPQTAQTVTTPGVDNSQQRRVAALQFLGQGGIKNSAATLQLASYGQSLQDTPATSKTTYATQPSPSTSGSVKAPSGTGATAALSWAESKIGNKETGHNSGGLASYANSRFGMSNQPWCAMFTSLAVTKGGAPSTARTASVATVRAKAQAGDGYQKGFIPAAKAKAGDLILFGNAHIGMVKSVSGNTITYVAGNQSDSVAEGKVPVGGGDIVRPLYGRK